MRPASCGAVMRITALVDPGKSWFMGPADENWIYNQRGIIKESPSVDFVFYPLDTTRFEKVIYSPSKTIMMVIQSI